jgi:hypothetical protein
MRQMERHALYMSLLILHVLPIFDALYVSAKDKIDSAMRIAYHSPTFSPIPHWHIKYWKDRSTASRLVAIFWKRVGDFDSAEEESTIVVLDVG